jgi:membrane-associated phospholipid phosphatase
MEHLWIWELHIIEQLQQVPDAIIVFFKLITSLVSENFYMILMPIFFWCIDMSIGYRFTLVLIFGNWSNTFFKMLFHFPRPFWISPNIEAHAVETSFGLPSGHSTGASSIWLFLAHQYKQKKALVVLFVSIMLLIMISRLFLGMHFISDVVSGFLLGVLVLVVLFWVDKKYATKIDALSISKKIWLSIAATIVYLVVGFLPVWTNTFVLPTEWIENSIKATGGVAPNPFDTKGIITLGAVFMSMNIGYALLKTSKHHMKTEGTIAQYLLRIFIGLVGVVVLRIGIKALYPLVEGVNLNMLDFIRYAIIAFWIAYVAPLIFLKLNLYKKSV